MSEYPFTFEDIDGEFSGCPLVKATPGNFVFTTPFVEDLKKIYNINVRPDDIWQIGVPKSGTTWLTELIYCVYHEGDLTDAKSKYPLEKWLLLELNAFRKMGEDEKADEKKENKPGEYFTRDGIETIENCKTKRFIRSHMPLSMLPPKLLDTCKVIYIARNPKDSFVSHYTMVGGSAFDHLNSWENVLQNFITDKMLLCPYALHTREAYEKRHHKNMLFILYEDMKKDLAGVIRRVAEFLDKKLSDEKVDLLVDHLSIKSMRQNKFANMEDLKDMGWLEKKHQFIRKGVAGDWKNHFTAEQLEAYNKWWNKHMAGCDFSFPE